MGFNTGTLDNNAGTINLDQDDIFPATPGADVTTAP
jgi:hypothetical protein